jgi:FkbM family methyltransferase
MARTSFARRQQIPCMNHSGPTSSRSSTRFDGSGLVATLPSATISSLRYARRGACLSIMWHSWAILGVTDARAYDICSSARLGISINRGNFEAMIKELVQSGLSRLGYQLVRVNAAPLDRFFGMLKQQGFNPRHVIDVGAHMGGFTRCALKYFPDASYTLIEPQGELQRHVQDLVARGYKVEWITAGVADKSGILDFTPRPNPVESSFLPTREQAEALGFFPRPIEVRTLNEVVATRHAPPPEMIKIDAEGFDLRVLAGASTFIGTTDIFLLEAAICCCDIENTAATVIRRMAEAGYRLIDITDINRSPKHDVQWLCDLAFLRNSSSLLDTVTSYE